MLSSNEQIQQKINKDIVELNSTISYSVASLCRQVEGRTQWLELDFLILTDQKFLHLKKVEIGKKKIMSLDHRF